MGVPARRETGFRVPVSPPSDQTQSVLCDVVMERHRQIHLHGHNEDTPDGTGPDVQWATAMGSAAFVEQALREDYEDHASQGQPLTWMHFLREEFAEAMQEDDPQLLYTELIQVAAVAVSWAEKIRQR